MKQKIINWLNQNKTTFIKMEKDIWNKPEPALLEHFASKTQRNYLQSIGFTIKEISNMPTAFYAEYGSGSPVIAILGEYDALPGMSQYVSVKREPIPGQKAGHACGHNLIGTAGVAAVSALKEITNGNFKGTIRYYGCPAEEQYAGKISMMEAGCFNDVDAFINWHPQDFNGVTHKQYYCALANVEFEFHGETGQSMAAKKYGGSALQASEIMIKGMHYMQEYMWDFYELHYAVINKCERANLIPETVKIECSFRAKKFTELKKIQDKLVTIAAGAALMTKTEVSFLFDTAALKALYHDLVNSVLIDTIKKNMLETEMITLNKEEQEFALALSGTQSKGAKEKTQAYYQIPENDICADMHTGVIDKDELVYLPFDDAGNISWMAPFGSFLASMAPVGMPMHCWQAAALSGSAIGEKTMMYAAKVMAGTIYELLTDPALLNKAKREFDTVAGIVK